MKRIRESTWRATSDSTGVTDSAESAADAVTDNGRKQGINDEHSITPGASCQEPLPKCLRSWDGAAGDGRLHSSCLSSHIH